MTFDYIVGMLVKRDLKVKATSQSSWSQNEKMFFSQLQMHPMM